MKAFISQFIVCQLHGREPHRLSRDLNKRNLRIVWMHFNFVNCFDCFTISTFLFTRNSRRARQTNAFDTRN